MKRCYACERELPLDQFHVNNTAKDGRARICRECKVIENRKRTERKRRYGSLTPEQWLARQFCERMARAGFPASPSSPSRFPQVGEQG